MAKILQYNAGREATFTDERSVQAAAGTGRAAGALTAQAGREQANIGEAIGGTIQTVGKLAVDYLTHRDTSSLSATGAEMMFKLDQEWNRRVKNADPNDPAVATTFREEVLEPALQKWAEGSYTQGGKHFAEQRVAQAREHFFKKTAADMGQLAGEAVAVNAHKTANLLSNMVKSDPTSLPLAMTMLGDSVSAMALTSPTIDGVKARTVASELSERGKAMLVKSAAMGIAETNPDALDKFTQDPKVAQYISGEDVKRLQGYARTQKNAARVAAHQEELLAERAKQKASDEKEDAVFQQIYGEDAKQMSARDIAVDPVLNTNAKRRLISMLEREMKPEAQARVSQQATIGLIERIRAPAGDPSKITDVNPIYEAYQRGDLTKGDFNFAMQQFRELRTPEGEALGARKAQFLAGVKAQIDKSNPLMGKIDQSGTEQFYRLQVEVDRQMGQLRAAGKDPWSLFDPQSPDYMGKPERLAPFRQSLEQSMKNFTAGMRTPSVTPSAPLPKPAAYPDAKQAPDGNWYVQRDGKYFKVN